MHDPVSAQPKGALGYTLFRVPSLTRVLAERSEVCGAPTCFALVKGAFPPARPPTHCSCSLLAFQALLFPLPPLLLKTKKSAAPSSCISIHALNCKKGRFPPPPPPVAASASTSLTGRHCCCRRRHHHHLPPPLLLLLLLLPFSSSFGSTRTSGVVVVEIAVLPVLPWGCKRTGSPLNPPVFPRCLTERERPESLPRS